MYPALKMAKEEDLKQYYIRVEVYSILYMLIYQGKWQEGLRLMFQDRMLYDIEPGTFNNSRFERDDLKWVRHAYLNQALMAWDHYFYDTDKNRYTIGDFIEMNNRVMGGAEIYGLWPTWQD
jgi:iron(II)-dependent oxidoreductase